MVWPLKQDKKVADHLKLQRAQQATRPYKCKSRQPVSFESAIEKQHGWKPAWFGLSNRTKGDRQSQATKSTNKGGGYLNPVSERCQKKVPSLNAVQIQSGGIIWMPTACCIRICNWEAPWLKANCCVYAFVTRQKVTDNLFTKSWAKQIFNRPHRTGGMELDTRSDFVDIFADMASSKSNISK